MISDEAETSFGVRALLGTTDSLIVRVKIYSELHGSETLDCGVERRAVPLIFHQEEVRWRAAFYLLLCHCVPLIRIVVLHTRVVQLLCVG